ncbi:hypothetical protein [Embleya sp. AB8]|uniref:hypothetical protein n=1 Tax=Embleya sp. AB8 TaxID=3156304 RepID=UPI003C754B53
MRKPSVRQYAAVAAAMIAFSSAGAIMAGPASAEDFRCTNQRCDQLNTWKNGAVSDIWFRVTDGWSQALANMQSGGGYVQALAQCENGNWILAGGKSYDNSNASHIDCGNAGYRNTLYGNGALYTSS